MAFACIEDFASKDDNFVIDVFNVFNVTLLFFLMHLSCM